MMPALPSWLASQRGTLAALASILLGLALGLVLRAAVGEAAAWRAEELLWVALPGHLFMRLLSGLSMPLVLPKLVSAIGSMHTGLG